MKLFVVLSLVALAAARPGYNYDRPLGTGYAGGLQFGGGSAFGNGFSSGNSFQSGNGFSSIPGAHYQQQARVVNAGPVFVSGSSHHNGFNHGGSFNSHSFGQQQQQQFQGNHFVQQQPIHLNVAPISTVQGPAFLPATGPAPIFNTGAVHSSNHFIQTLPAPAPAPQFNVGPAPSQVLNTPNFIPTGQHQAGQTVVQKHIYVHVPPPEQDEVRQQQTQFLPAAPPRKHYKIIFIKTPTVQNNAALIQQQAAAAQTQEKTLIYVLVKKPEDNAQIIEQAAAAAFQPTKPEVYFIKYKSRGNAQQEQQQQGGFIGAQQSGVGSGAVIHEGGAANLGQNIHASGSGNLIAPAVNLNQQGFGTGASSQVVTGAVVGGQNNAYVPPKPHSDYGVPH